MRRQRHEEGTNDRAVVIGRFTAHVVSAPRRACGSRLLLTVYAPRVPRSLRTALRGRPPRYCISREFNIELVVA